MLKHYILTSLRNIRRHRLFSAINIFGLAIGLASFLIIYLYVQDELQYDTFHKDSDRVYRIIQDYKKTSGGAANLPGALEQKLKGNVPQARALTSIYKDHKVVITSQDHTFPEDGVYFTESQLFRILSLRLIEGNPEKALDGPFKMVITPETAEKYFGQQNPIGQSLTIDHKHTYEITGILESLPEQSHLDIDFLASLSSIKKTNTLAYTHWGFSASHFYLKLYDQADPQAAERLINDLFLEEQDEGYEEHVQLKLQALRDIYLHSAGLEYDIARHGNIKYVMGFAALALFILLIVGFNYMNLSTARMSIREKEIGMRKIVGAPRQKIIFQFLGESLVHTLLAAALALLLVRLSLPWFNQISGKSLSTGLLLTAPNALVLAGIIAFMTLFSGSYPALVLSGTRPLSVMSGAGSNPASLKGRQKNGHFRFRQALVFLQFAISVFLIIAAIVVYKQIHFIQHKNLGLNQEQVMIVKNPYNDQVKSRYQAFADKIHDFPEVQHVSSTFSAPPHPINNQGSLYPQGQEDEGKSMGFVSVNHNYFKTIGASFLKGRDFSEDFKSDAYEGVILNETAAKRLGKDAELNTVLEGFYNNRKRRVIGIVEDIHFLSAHKKMPPLAFFVSQDEYPSCYPEIVIKLETPEIMGTVKKLRSAWGEVAPGWPFEMTFMDQKFEALYRTEQDVKQVLTLFTGLAIFLSVLGLFGLAAFSTDRRMREIGIRKAMGARMKNIAVLLSGEFLFWILVSNLVAWPAAWWVMKGWLNHFVYKTPMSVWVFIAAAMGTMMVTGIILAYQTIRASKANPAGILREQ
jgi:putative ABC transport system permease protein